MIIFIRFVHSHNRAKLNFTLQLDHLSDLHDEEIELMKGNVLDPKDLVLRKEIDEIPRLRVEIPKEPPPKHLDWRNYGE